MHLATAFFAAALSTSPAPVSLQILDIKERPRTGNPVLQSYERVRVRIANQGTAPVTFQLCPEDARSINAWVDGRGASTTVRAFAASVGDSSAFNPRCQPVPLQAGESRVVNYYIRGENRDVRAQRREFRFATNVGAYVLRLPTPTS